MNRYALSPLGLAAFIVLLAPAVHAEPLKADFDKGVDASQALNEVRQKVPLNRIDSARVQRAITTGTTTKGPVIGADLPERVTGSEPYQSALQYPPLLENLKPEVRDPLKAQWSGINVTRGELLTDASGLEAEDRALLNRATELDRNAERLNQRSAQLDAEIDNFNRQCTGRPLPPDQYNACVRWRDDLQHRINAHNNEVAQHNTRVEQWRNEATDLRRRAGTAGKTPRKQATSFLARVAVWEQRVIQFSSAAKKALEEAACGRLKGVSISPTLPPPLRTSANQLFSATASFDAPADKPCPITYLWRTKNTTGNIGSLSVDPAQTRATLSTGNDPAKGAVIIEVDEVMGKGKQRFEASAPVTVSDIVLQCDVVGHRCDQIGSQFQVWCTYKCCGDFLTEVHNSPRCTPDACPTKFCVPK